MADNRYDAVVMLRRGTQDLHQQLESTPLFTRLSDADVTLGDYLRVLDALQRLYAGFETGLIRGLQQFAPDYSYIPRLPLLQRDLVQLGGTLVSGQNLPSPSTAGLATTLGSLYVIEGSMLGGKLIRRHLQKCLGTEVSGALSFYGLDGDWSATQTMLRGNLTSNDIDQAVLAARQTFSLFIGIAEATH